MSADRKLELFPGARLSPEVTLHRVLEAAGNIEAVAIVWIEKDRTPHVGWSQMSCGDLTWCAAQLDDAARDLRNGDWPEDVVKPDGAV
jgi:hypothetical protein